VVGGQVFATIPSIFVAGRAAIPGDYGYSTGSDIEDFLMRLKYSLSNSTEMLSNTVGFWMAGEMAAKQWDIGKVEATTSLTQEEVPGVNVGLPEGVSGYPAHSPEIP